MESNLLISTLELALDELALDEIASPYGKVIITTEGRKSKAFNTRTLVWSDMFDVSSDIDFIGNAKHVGIVDSSKMDPSKLLKLINALKNKDITMIVIRTNPISCQIIRPEPSVGTSYKFGNYEYHYGQKYVARWIDVHEQKGWGVKTIDNTQTDYESPLTTIFGYPVTNMTCLFYCNQMRTLNLIDWDTSNVDTMNTMFAHSKATQINGLNLFCMDKVNLLSFMFDDIGIETLDLSSFNLIRLDPSRRIFSCKVKNIIFGSHDDARCYAEHHRVRGANVTVLPQHSTRKDIL